MSELNGTLTSSVNLIGSFGGASTGTSDYNELSNKPSINGVELSGNKTGAQLNLVSDSDLATVATTGNYNDLLHKPVIPAAQVNSDWNSTSGVSAILNKPDIPAAQVNSDWNSTSGVSEILNKPTLSAVATSGDYDDLTNKPTIPAAQVNSDWNSDSGVSEILNKPTLSAVATSGDYDDLTNKPTIPVNSDFALSGLSDTDITTPTQSGQVLAYDGNGKVVNTGINNLPVKSWIYNGQRTINGLTGTSTWDLISAIPNTANELLFTICIGANHRVMRWSLTVPFDVFGDYGCFPDFSLGSDRIYCTLSKISNSQISISGVNIGSTTSDITLNCYYR